MSINSNIKIEEVKQIEAKEPSLAEIYFNQAEELRCNNQFKEFDLPYVDISGKK